MLHGGGGDHVDSCDRCTSMKTVLVSGIGLTPDLQLPVRRVVVWIVSSSAVCSFVLVAVCSWIITSASAHDHDRERAWRPPMHGERERGACCVRGDGAGESERERPCALRFRHCDS